MGVNRYFLTKILDENDKARFGLDEILTFCQFIKNNLPNNPSVTRELSDIQSFFSTYLGSADLSLIDDQEESLDLDDRFNFFVLLLACCDNGFTKEQIASTLGENSKKNITNLLKSDHIEETSEGKVRVKDGHPTFFSPAVIARHITDLMKFYRLSRRQQKRNYLNIKIQGLTKEALEKVIEIQRDCDRRILDIIVDEKNIGPNPVFSVNCVDTFTEELR